MRVVVLLAVAVVLSLSCTKARETAKMGATRVAPTAHLEGNGVRVTDEERACVADDDCTLTTEECCGCSALGRQTGARVDRITALQKRRDPICAVIACAAAMSDDPTCSASEAVCRDGLCTADAPSARAPAPIPTEPISPP